MASTLTMRGAAISLEALQMGAADFVPKPTSTAEVGSSAAFARELIEKTLAFGARSRVTRSISRPGTDPARKAGAQATTGDTAKRSGGIYGNAPIVLRRVGLEKPRVLAIGSSTGGPQALFRLFDSLKGIRLPVLLTQHMPPHFTAILAEHLARITGMACREAEDGEPLVESRIFVAPGDFHMIVEDKGNNKLVVRKTKTPPENFCRPAVDPMLRSIAQCFGGRCLTLILTGMGQDGMIGGREIVRAGGTIVAQDEATSVVWGMPGAVATAGLCSAVLPLDRIAAHLRTLIGES
jgi:two-component system chemotaxis response regulator CheB